MRIFHVTKVSQETPSGGHLPPPSGIPNLSHCFQNVLPAWRNMYFWRTLYYGGIGISLCVGDMLMGWTKCLALASDSQHLLCKPLTRPPRGVSRVHEPETAEETAFDLPSTLKIKAKRAFGKGPSGLAKSRALGKCLETFHQIQSEAGGPGAGHSGLFAACLSPKQSSSTLLWAA